MGNCCPREAALLDDSREAEFAAASAPVKSAPRAPAPAEHAAISLLDDSGEDDRDASASAPVQSAPPAPARGNHAAIPLLAALDDKLAAALAAGAIALVNAEVFRSSELGEGIMRRQDLERLERERSVKIFLTPDEAVAALRSSSRSAGALTYGWTAPGHPDMGGEYLAAVRCFLRGPCVAHIRAVFWE
jgi:hypothetical protein